MGGPEYGKRRCEFGRPKEEDEAEDKAESRGRRGKKLVIWAAHFGEGRGNLTTEKRGGFGRPKEEGRRWGRKSGQKRKKNRNWGGPNFGEKRGEFNGRDGRDARGKLRGQAKQRTLPN